MMICNHCRAKRFTLLSNEGSSRLEAATTVTVEARAGHFSAELCLARRAWLKSQAWASAGFKDRQGRVG